jgi:small subunit ribosomal protein S4
MVYRAAFASSRQQARQLITHGHFAVNGQPASAPSALLRDGDVVSVKEGRQSRLKPIVAANRGRDVPPWLEANGETMVFSLIAPPNVERIGQTIAVNLIVEYYSR